VGLGAAWSQVTEFTAAPARAAGTVVADDGDGGAKIAEYLSEQKFI
jgi:electron transfer flavoprotein beta subunit